MKSVGMRMKKNISETYLQSQPVNEDFYRLVGNVRAQGIIFYLKLILNCRYGVDIYVLKEYIKKYSSPVPVCKSECTQHAA